MKNNNLLITVAIVLIAIAGFGWFVTGQAAPSSTQPDPFKAVPLVNQPADNSLVDRTDRQTGYNRNHHNSDQHCHNEKINERTRD